MAIGVPQLLGSNHASSVTSLAITTTAAILSGDLVLVAIGYNNTGGGTVSSVSDGTNTYSKAVGTKNTNGGNELWYKANAAAVSLGATLTVTMSNSTGRLIIESARVSGILTSTPLDKTATSTATSVSTGLLSQANELVIGTFGGANETAITEDASFTNLYSIQEGTSQVWENFAYKIVSSTASVTYQPTITGDGTQYVYAIASFKGGVTASTLAAAAGAYTLAGIAARLGKGYTVAAALGAYVLTGIATFKKLSMPASFGTYTLTGVAAIPKKALHMAVAVGSYAVTGVSAVVKKALHLTASVGSYALTGITLLEVVLPGPVNLIRKTKFVLQKLRTTAPTLDE